jgi:hypothetical protein
LRLRGFERIRWIPNSLSSPNSTGIKNRREVNNALYRTYIEMTPQRKNIEITMSQST